MNGSNRGTQIVEIIIFIGSYTESNMFGSFKQSAHITRCK